jgi:maltooligosyltrehalose trehalohydrolase
MAHGQAMSSQPSSALVAPPHVSPFLGARAEEHGVRFRVHGPQASACAIELVDDDGVRLTLEECQPGDGGVHEVFVAGLAHGALYMVVLDGTAYPDPYARFLPFGVFGPAMVTEARHVWRHESVPRPLAETVIYELHIGTFTPEGTYRAATQRLADLAALGITAIELMPLSAFAGQRGWGYDGVAHFAPFAGYGTPDELRALVDEAHGLGLSVILDVVYNHFGPAGNYLPQFSDQYFSKEHQNSWGQAPDFQRPLMRQYVCSNALYWLDEFRFDGLRLDATHSLIDESDHHILRELADRVLELRPRKLLMAEDDRNDPALVASLGMDGVWADDFHHCMRVTLTGERDGYFAAYPVGAATIADTINNGWLYCGQTYPPAGRPRGFPSRARAESFIYCIQNHDQVGNRAAGDRLSSAVDLDRYCLASAVLLFLPMTPLIFMGQEWAATTPFQYFTDHEPELGRLVSQGRREEFKGFAAFSSKEQQAQIPDPQDPQTFERSRLDWTERDRPAHMRVLRLYRDLLALRRADPVLSRAGRESLKATALGGVLVVRRWTSRGQRVLLANFGEDVDASELVRQAFFGQTVILSTSSARSLELGVLPGRSAVILGSA